MRAVALLLLLIAAMAQPLRAADTPPAIDIMLALDNSGSMKKNDPQRLLPKVVTEFAGRLGPEDRLGIVAFDQTVRTLLPLSQVKGDNFGSALTAALHQVNYSGRLTDIPGGLEAARKEIETHGRSDAQRVVVLLTDGEIDLGSESRNSERKIWLRDRILPAASRQGIRIFGITLTADADVQLIQTMAEATQGNYYRLLTAEEIPAVFNGILTRLQEIRDRQAADEAAAAEAKAREQRDRDQRGRDQAPPPIAPQAPIVVQVPVGSSALPTPWLFGVAAGAILFIVVIVIFLLRRRDQIPSISVPAARLIDLGGQTGEPEPRLKGVVTRIGLLDDRNDIVVKSEGISREHALIEFKDNAFYLRDLRSTNGTFLNDKPVAPDDRSGQMLRHGDILRFGPYSFRFVIDHMLEAEKEGDGKRPVGETVRLPGAPVTRRVSAAAGPAAPGITDHPLHDYPPRPAHPGGAQPEAAQQAPAVKPGLTLVKEPGKAPSFVSHAVAPGDHCDVHRARMAVARCAHCGHLICDLEEPVDQPDGGKSCRVFVEGGTCPHQAPPKGLTA
jgi:pSer/pThr/pTyr-binding forkhead associated (FHA) protein